MKNKKLFFGITVATIIMGMVFFGPTQTLAEEVIIITDKTEYEQGEEINATLNYEGEIYQWGNCGW